MEKDIIIKKIKRHNKVITSVVVIFIGSEVGSYYYHVEECIYTGRKRYMGISNEDLCKLIGNSANEVLI